MTRTLLVLGFAAAIWAYAPVAGSAPFSVVDIGSLPEGGGGVTAARSINNLGAVVGYDRNSVCGDCLAFYWNQGAISRLVGLPGSNYELAYAINDQGAVVGYSGTTPETVRPVLWQNGVPEDLGIFADGSDRGSAYAINNLGQVLGSSGGLGIRTAFLWENGTKTPINQLAGFGPYLGQEITAASINDITGIAGSMFAPGGTQIQQAYVWQQGVVTEIPRLPGFGDSNSAVSINNGGQVVGWSEVQLPTRQLHAFLWDGSVLIDLGALPGGLGWSVASDVNNQGQVVGQSLIGFNFQRSDSHAFLWDAASGLFDLNGQIDLSLGISLFAATGINDNGQIIANGYYCDSPDVTHAFLLSPTGSPSVAGARTTVNNCSTADPNGSVPEPHTLALLALGLAGLAATRSRNHRAPSLPK